MSGTCSVSPTSTERTPLPNFDFVTDRLATGGDLHWREDQALADLAALVAAGITHVVDCRQEWTDEEFVARHAPQITYLHVGVDDAGGRQPDWFFDEGVAFALDALAVPGSKVLTHCHMGINRGPSLAYAVLLALGSDPVQAMDTIRGVRPIAAVGYAEGALDWHHRGAGLSEFERAAQRRALRTWRAGDTLDVAAVIRGIRAAEGTELR